jgi:hypothetical protein
MYLSILMNQIFVLLMNSKQVIQILGDLNHHDGLLSFTFSNYMTKHCIRFSISQVKNYNSCRILNYRN